MRHRGFTLIELLVVIAIIAILAAILFPVFAQAREKARQAGCLSNGKQMATGLMMYAQDYDERLPRWWTPDGGKDNKQRDWKNDIEPYVKNWDVYRCPSRHAQWPGYGYNAYFAVDTGVSLGSIQFVSKQLLVADIRELAPGSNAAVDRSLPTGCKFPNGDLRFQAEARHQGGLIAVFADGSARRLQESRFTRVTAPGTTDSRAVSCFTNNAKDPAIGTYWLPSDTSP
jgi:prepilin-type N-terminal cleavage/methylation domain-containing protein/prepilin-type processing-associated H-X9-DG protein